SLLLERLSEVAVLISLFTAGLKLNAPFEDSRWALPFRLAFVSMAASVGLTTLVGVMVMGLPLGVAVLCGAVLAPTDPVLASDVQVEHAGDRDRLRFALTGEAGLNDGSTLPFILLGLGLLGLHPLGETGWRWLLLDVLWSTAAGAAIGFLIGTSIGRVVVHLRTRHKEALGLDEFLTLGLIALAYGVAVICSSNGFLSVFAAGLALRRIQARHKQSELAPQGVSRAELAASPEQAPTYMTEAVLDFNEQLERLGELTLVLLVAGTLRLDQTPEAALWFVPLLLGCIRPLSVWLGTLASRSTGQQRALMGWFGIRGIGSVYYLMFIINHGLPEPYRSLLVGLTLTTVAVSIVVHGISVTPLMNQYTRMNRLVRRRAKA
ncbi:MAG TPA: cation:proton antiporter, partial [Polyangiaceae bacterium]|nr:cation:proton antiporter [Polyangiaceae bacterium]